MLLAAKLDGSKCRPFVVLPSKRKLTGKEWKQFATIKNQFKSRIELNAKPESSIDSSDLKRLLPTLLGRSQTTRKLVVWDSRSSHEEMTRFLKSRAVDSILVPENAVEVLQVSLQVYEIVEVVDQECKKSFQLKVFSLRYCSWRFPFLDIRFRFQILNSIFQILDKQFRMSVSKYKFWNQSFSTNL